MFSFISQIALFKCHFFYEIFLEFLRQIHLAVLYRGGLFVSASRTSS